MCLPRPRGYCGTFTRSTERERQISASCPPRTGRPRPLSPDLVWSSLSMLRWGCTASTRSRANKWAPPSRCRPPWTSSPRSGRERTTMAASLWRISFPTEVRARSPCCAASHSLPLVKCAAHVLHRVDIADGMDEANLRNLPSEDLVCSASDVLWCTTLESGSNYVYTIPPAGGVPTLISESIGESLGFDEYGNLNELVNQEVEPDTTPITIYRLNPSDGMWDEVYTIIGLPIDTYTLLGFDRNVISACVPNCAGKSCGENSGCNTPCDVESCTGVDAYCDAFVCVTSVQPCTPDCVGKGCGADDGCSGTCDADETCTQYPNSFCNGVACDCAPSCVGQCGGDNGCGGVCPDCGETDVCWTASTADACAALACEWCTLWEDGGQSYGQCLGGGECAEVHALCGSGAEGFGCIYGDVDHFVWCTADWFKGMMQCPPGTACDAAPYVLSGNFTCSYVL
eukprot:TRINITY_DN9824_c0_g1_i2.p1 TRINITY_DN9824_c0_g1~~TRINITY_DN9824_c0_g1_i2.p1  ORF type:complete len:456 (-),score=76.83 TRINITY_DN9824_c0_g1_i2:39-1406(-)